MQARTGEGAVIDGIERMEGFLEKAKGLMFKDRGRVLLVFSTSDRHSIWMPFMRFSLDVAFIDRDGSVVHTEEDVPPLSFHPSTWKRYKPPRPCRSILEVESGLFEEKGIETGTELSF